MTFVGRSKQTTQLESESSRPVSELCSFGEDGVDWSLSESGLGCSDSWGDNGGDGERMEGESGGDGDVLSGGEARM